MNKTIKLAISLNQDDIEYKDLCKELFEMQYLSAKASNRIMTFLYADKQQEFIMKDAGIDIPAPTELYGKSRMTYLYNKMAEIMTTSNSANISQARAFVENQFSKDVKKGLLKGNCSLTNFRRDSAIYLHNKSYTLFETEKGLGVKISLFSKSHSKELGLKNGIITFSLPHINAGEKSILIRMMSKEYKQGSGSLTYNKHKKKWMLAMSYTFTPEECTGENTLNVRLGEEVLLRLTAKKGETELRMKPYDKVVPGLEELVAVRKKFMELRRTYGNATRIASDNNCGKGYRKRADKLLKLQDKERRFRDTFNHKISRYIVDMAQRYDCGLIELEDFSETENAAFGDWAYYDLQQKITYKAQEKGIEVMEVSSKKEEIEMA